MTLLSKSAGATTVGAEVSKKEETAPVGLESGNTSGITPTDRRDLLRSLGPGSAIKEPRLTADFRPDLDGSGPLNGGGTPPLTLPPNLGGLPGATLDPDRKRPEPDITKLLTISEITSKLDGLAGGNHAGSAVSSVVQNLSPEEKKLLESYLRTKEERDRLATSPLAIRMPEFTPEQKTLLKTIETRAKSALSSAVESANSSLSPEQKAALTAEQQQYAKAYETYVTLRANGVEAKKPEPGNAMKEFHKKLLDEIDKAAKLHKEVAPAEVEKGSAISLLESGLF